MIADGSENCRGKPLLVIRELKCLNSTECDWHFFTRVYRSLTTKRRRQCSGAKANHGFQARFDPKAPPIGHLRQTRWLFNMDNPDGVKALKAAGFLDLQGFPDNTASEFLEALLAHHGKPVAQQVTAGDRDLWLPKNGIDPVDE